MDPAESLTYIDLRSGALLISSGSEVAGGMVVGWPEARSAWTVLAGAGLAVTSLPLWLRVILLGVLVADLWFAGIFYLFARWSYMLPLLAPDCLPNRQRRGSRFLVSIDLDGRAANPMELITN